MDLHPIFVHFPVALITLFALFEILPLEKKFGKTYFMSKFLFLCLGVLMSIPAYLTGGAAEEAIEHGPLHDVVELHGFFAGVTIVVAVALFVIYLVRLGTEYKETVSGRYIAKYVPETVLAKLKFVTAKGVCVFLAIVLLLLVTATGALGGSLVYGPDVDPIAKMLYKVFGL
jgi:uncharacterized membrane protein